MSFRTFEESQAPWEEYQMRLEKNTHCKCALRCVSGEKLQMEQTSQKTGGRVKTDCKKRGEVGGLC